MTKDIKKTFKAYEPTKYSSGITVAKLIAVALHRMNKEKINFEYNKYISKCIIYTYNNKLLNNDGLNGDILSYLYYLIKEYTNVKSLENMNNLKRYIEYYTIPLKVIEKFMKYYQNIYYLLIEKKSLRLFIE